MADMDGGSDMPFEYFDAIYGDRADPWGFDTSWYERRKYRITLALLSHPRYRRAVEPGCSIGALTELLAERCDELIAFDFHPPSVERARSRTSGCARVEVREETFPTFWPDGTGDLVVWSEVAYYLNIDGARAALDGLERWLEPGGDLVATHYTGATNYPRAGRAIAPWLDAVPFLQRTALCTDTSFEAGVWTRTG